MFRLRSKRSNDTKLSAGITAFDKQVRQFPIKERNRLITDAHFTEANLHRLTFPRDARIANTFRAHKLTHILHIAIRGFGQRRFHVNLQQEMHAAPQIKTQIHRTCIDGRQPARRIGQQIQRDDIAVTEFELKDIFRA